LKGGENKMLKKVLKSVLVLSLVLATGVGASRAYFTSTVTAADNQVEAGTLRLAVDATGHTESNYDPDSEAGYWVAYDDGTQTVTNQPFEKLDKMQPGEVQSVYVGVRNFGNLPLDYRFFFDGSWPNGDDRNQGNKNIRVERVHRFATGDCQGDWGCGNLRDYYQDKGYTWASVSRRNEDNLYLGQIYEEDASLEEEEFNVYRLDFKMLESAGNEYQGQVFTYDMTTEAKQVNASSF
jgi:predicted ribosomally synthesized peptide with SipW-like signal peptide